MTPTKLSLLGNLQGKEETNRQHKKRSDDTKRNRREEYSEIIQCKERKHREKIKTDKIIYMREIRQNMRNE